MASFQNLQNLLSFRYNSLNLGTHFPTMLESLSLPVPDPSLTWTNSPERSCSRTVQHACPIARYLGPSSLRAPDAHTKTGFGRRIRTTTCMSFRTLDLLTFLCSWAYGSKRNVLPGLTVSWTRLYSSRWKLVIVASADTILIVCYLLEPWASLISLPFSFSIMKPEAL